jgi:hypothetical protein
MSSASVAITKECDIPTPFISEAERDDLLLDHLPQVRYVARRIHGGCRPRCRWRISFTREF